MAHREIFAGLTGRNFRRDEDVEVFLVAFPVDLAFRVDERAPIAEAFDDI